MADEQFWSAAVAAMQRFVDRLLGATTLSANRSTIVCLSVSASDMTASHQRC
ncbi:hypothetical protein AB0L14_35045 [Streptomyces sp. NPDC052727]|uniref:hypothetical protein n=1 Tax=Streptomyces sp. NPDC052727 TaxID=3154854 RepID=UPI0034473454